MDASQLVEGGSFMQTSLQCAAKGLVVLNHPAYRMAIMPDRS
jgi:hypothetical protein